MSLSNVSRYHDMCSLQYQPMCVLPEVSNLKNAFDFSKYTRDEFGSTYFLERDLNILIGKVIPMPLERFDYNEANYPLLQSPSLISNASVLWKGWMKDISENFEEITHRCPARLAKANGEISSEFKKIVKESVENNDVDFFKWYAENVNVNSSLSDDEETVLIYASHYGKRDIAKIILESGADVNHIIENDFNALIVAASQGHTDIVKMLLEAGADVNHTDAQGFNALLWAAENGRIDSVKMLLNFGADIRHMSFDRSNALTCAIFRGHPDLVKMLIEFGADVNHIGGNGHSTLTLASCHGNREIVRMLIDAGVDVNHVKEGSHSALILASSYGYAEIVRMLIDAGSNVNRVNEGSHTALTLASRDGYTEIVRMLIDAGADYEVRRKDGANAFFLGEGVAVEVLIEVLAKKSAQESKLGNEDFIRTLWEDPYVRIKLLGHIWEIKGNISWEDFKTELTGGVPHLFGFYMSANLKKYLHDYPSALSVASQESIINALEAIAEKSQYPTEILLDKFQKKLPVIIYTGWNEHAVYVVFYDNYFAICNKGQGSIKPVELYQIDPTLVTADIFEKLKSLKQKNESDFRELFGPDKNLSAFRTKSSLLEQMGCETPRKCVVDILSPIVDRFDAKHSLQKVGNCAWENLEVAVHLLMGLTKLSEEGFNGATSSEETARLESSIQRTFEGWEQFTQMEILESFMAHHQFSQNEKISAIENIVRNAPKLPQQEPFYDRFVKVIDDVYRHSSLYQKLSFYWSAFMS